MPTESDFIREIRDNPEDGFLMLVYADWLDDQGHPLGELIRVEIEMRESSGGRFSRLRRRADELREEMGVPPRIETCPACAMGEGAGYRPHEFYPDAQVPFPCPYCKQLGNVKRWYHPIRQVVLGEARLEGEDIARKVKRKLKQREWRQQKKLERTGG